MAKKISRTHRPRIATAALAGLAALAALPLTAHAQFANLWTDIPDPPAHARTARSIVPSSYRSIELNVSSWNAMLATIPAEGRGAAGTEIELPMPDGTMQRFAILDTPVMAPGLAIKFPDFRTFAGQGIDDPLATVRLDWTSAGFRAQILSPDGAVYIDPVAPGSVDNYISYRKSDYSRLTGGDVELLAPIDPGGERSAETDELLAMGRVARFSGATLRTYRLAMATTGEYSTFHGGTVPLVAAELVTLVNRVTGIYEVEISARLELIANNDDLIYLDAGTDPYTNGDAFALLTENQANVDSVIGSANYDVGHVVSTGGGGLAALGVICNASAKAQGETGLSFPIGDPFYVDFVAHELGHQFAGNHTWNGSGGSCSSGNRNGSTAYEPGSGSTIQAYAGICGAANDLQPNSDPYFHTASFDEMVAHTTVGSGSTCGTTAATGNSPPVPDAGPGGFSIPRGTAFELTGTGTDPDFDALTFNWEQYDLGPQGVPASPSGDAPIFRSFTATTSPTRTFPQIGDILAGTSTIGELLPSSGRTLTFRLTARDNRLGGGGVAHDEMSFTVDGGSGPFEITSPSNATVWPSNSNATITWDVAGTDSPPVSCANVDITFSDDGGATFPTVLAAATPNDGSEVITAPNLTTTQARVRIECCPDPDPAPSACFFAISGTSDFSVQMPIPAVCAASPEAGCLDANQAKLQYSEKKAGKEKMKLQWKKIASSTTQGDFGNPVSGLTEVALCIYDDADMLVQDFIVARPGDVCAGKPCWKAKGTKGYGYKDKDVSNLGISKIGLSSGDAGKGKTDAQGKNNSAKGQLLLPTGVVTALSGNVAPTVQLIVGDGICVTATMTDVKKDDGLSYSAQKK